MRQICFIGASTTEGMGDEDGLGWPGRLWRAHQGSLDAFVAYNLGIRGQTLNQIRKRARAECEARLLQSMGPLVVLGTGANDLSRFADGDYQGRLRTPFAALERNFRALVGDLSDIAQLLVIGPAPINEAKMPFRLANQMQFDFRNEDIETGSLLYRDICAELSIPFFDLYSALVVDPIYGAALANGDGLHPDGSGYQVCADVIGGWPLWKKAIHEGWAR